MMFKAGDRVRKRCTKDKGTCLEPIMSCPLVEWDSNLGGATIINHVHPELLIKLKPKVKKAAREWWIVPPELCIDRQGSYTIGPLFLTFKPQNTTGYIHVREVLE